MVGLWYFRLIIVVITNYQRYSSRSGLKDKTPGYEPGNWRFESSLLFDGDVAQAVEQMVEVHRVGGASPPVSIYVKYTIRSYISHKRGRIRNINTCPAELGV